MLDRRRDDAGIDDLPTAGDEARVCQLATDRLADVADQILLLQPLAPYPDRLGIGHPTAALQTGKAQETGAIQQLVFQGIVGQVVQLLQHQQSDHQFGRIRWPPSAPGIADHQLGVHRLDQGREVNGSIQHLQRVAQTIPLGVALFSGKQADHETS